jgi:hypothetical protein
LSPEEKAQKFKEMQREIFNGYIKDFKEEEKMIEEEINISEKLKDAEKREKEEFKKLDKVFAKEQGSMDEIY